MHFTYDAQPRPDLLQGDLIRRTDAVDEILKAVHPHYFQSPNYRYFLVLTQSCDLVRRDGNPCNGRYISIAAVRPLQKVVEREMQKLQHDDIEKQLGFCSKDRQPKLTQFMERLINNNEEEYFYLHRESSVGLVDDHCAFLQLSIALKAHVHYDTLLAARILSLKESFQHKLGYLVGTLYSRVGTEDWLEKQDKIELYRELTQDPLKNKSLVVWLDKDIHRRVLDRLKKIENPTMDDLNNTISEIVKTKETRKQETLNIISDVLLEMQVPAETVKKACSRLENRSDFAVKFK
jgi:putative ubiquitin-RnfH superfamily antitoxin RatB of RatAB toxin-antitoxin module